MAIVDRATLKSYFNANDVPTEAQYVDLIDSFSSLDEVGELTKVDLGGGDYNLYNLLTDAGKLGLGTNSPTSKIHVPMSAGWTATFQSYLNIGHDNTLAVGATALGDDLIVGSGSVAGGRNIEIGNSSAAFGLGHSGAGSGSSFAVGANHRLTDENTTCVFGERNSNSDLGGQHNFVAGDLITFETTTYTFLFGENYTVSNINNVFIYNSKGSFITAPVSSGFYAVAEKVYLESGTGGTNIDVGVGGNMNIKNLPTNATGLVAGDIWNDSGTLKIV